MNLGGTPSGAGPQSAHKADFFKGIIPPFAAAPKFGGPSFTTANKDYGNFVDSKRIDDLISNVR